jgi:hypothetical protein
MVAAAVWLDEQTRPEPKTAHENVEKAHYILTFRVLVKSPGL